MDKKSAVTPAPLEAGGPSRLDIETSAIWGDTTWTDGRDGVFKAMEER